MRELFRKSVRIVIYQLNLLLMINKRCASDYLEVRAMEEFLGRDKDTARFNKEHYKRRFQAKLSRHLMYVMKKEPHERTPKEIECIKELLCQMNIRTILNLMQGRSQATRKDFARIIRFMRVPPGRIIVRQGHEASSIYLLMRGEVLVFYTTIDPRTGGVVANLVALEKDGYDFGAGVDGFKDFRAHTVVSKEVCDILWIDKEEFDSLIDMVEEIDRGTTREFLLKVLPSTIKDEDSLDFLIKHCVYQEYPPDTIVPVEEFLNKKGKPKFVFFVYSGICVQYRHIHMKERLDKFGNTLVELDTDTHYRDKVKCTEGRTRRLSPRMRERQEMERLEKQLLQAIADADRQDLIKVESKISETGFANAADIPKKLGPRARLSLPGKLELHFSKGSDDPAGATDESDNELDKDQSGYLTVVKPVPQALPNYSDQQIPAHKEPAPAKGMLPKLGKWESETHTMTRLHPGSFFGVGEHMHHTSYGTEPRRSAEFLVVPRDAFESRLTLNHQLYMMADTLNFSRPSSADIYRDLKQQREWNEYKSSTLKEVLRRQNHKKGIGGLPRIRDRVRPPITKYLLTKNYDEDL